MNPLDYKFGGILRHAEYIPQRFFQSIAFTFQGLFLLLSPVNWWDHTLISDLNLSPRWFLIPAITGLIFLYRYLKHELFSFFLFVSTWLIVISLIVIYAFSTFNFNHLGQIMVILLCALWIAKKNGGWIFTLMLVLQA